VTKKFFLYALLCIYLTNIFFYNNHIYSNAAELDKTLLNIDELDFNDDDYYNNKLISAMWSFDKFNYDSNTNDTVDSKIISFDYVNDNQNDVDLYLDKSINNTDRLYNTQNLNKGNILILPIGAKLKLSAAISASYFAIQDHITSANMRDGDTPILTGVSASLFKEHIYVSEFVSDDDPAVTDIYLNEQLDMNCTLDIKSINQTGLYRIVAKGTYNYDDTQTTPANNRTIQHLPVINSSADLYILVTPDLNRSQIDNIFERVEDTSSLTFDALLISFANYFKLENIIEKIDKIDAEVSNTEKLDEIIHVLKNIRKDTKRLETIETDVSGAREDNNSNFTELLEDTAYLEQIPHQLDDIKASNLTIIDDINTLEDNIDTLETDISAIAGYTAQTWEATFPSASRYKHTTEKHPRKRLRNTINTNEPKLSFEIKEKVTS
jgi:hypothetical protein